MSNQPHILFVCARNQWRSPTAERLYANDARIVVRSAGVGSKSRHQLSVRDIEWADFILVMDNKHKSRIVQDFRGSNLPLIESLDIPDEYQFMDEELQRLIRESTEDFLLELLES